MTEWKPFMKKKMSELTPQEQEEKRQYYKDWGAGRKKKQAEEPPPEKSTKKVLKKESKSTPKRVSKGPSGNGKVNAADLLENDKVPEEVKDKIREAQGVEHSGLRKSAEVCKGAKVRKGGEKHANNMLPDGDCNKSQSITIPLTGTLDLSRLIEEIRKEQPGSVTDPRFHMEVLVVPQEDGQAIWDITNDLATMNLHLKRNNEIPVQIERHLAALAEALEKK